LLFFKEELDHFCSAFQKARTVTIKLAGGIPTPSLEPSIKKRIGSFIRTQVIIPKDLQKEHDIRVRGKVMISNLPLHLADEILMNYLCEKYCIDCIENGNLSLLKWGYDFSYCEKHGMQY